MAGRAGTDADHRARIARVVGHLEERLDDPIDLDALARRAAYAKHHFHRVFRGVTGESVLAHVRRLRLERAARRLRVRGASVTRAALEAGYDAPEAFTRAFVAHFGAPPSLYKGEPAPRVAALAAALRPPDVEVRTLEAIDVVALRHVGSWTTVSETFAALIAAVGLPPQARLYGLCPDDPDVTREEQLRFDACVAPRPPPRSRSDADPALAPTLARLTRMTIPAGTYAIAVHRGAYTALSETYLRLIGRWLPTSPFVLADEPVVEAYLDDPAVTPEADRRTEVRVRIAR